MAFHRKSSLSTKIHCSPLHKVAKYGRFDSLKCLVECGRFFIDCKDERWMTPLGILVEDLLDKTRVKDILKTSEIEKKIKFLLMHGADPLKGHCRSIIEDLFDSENKTLISMVINFIGDINAPVGAQKGNILHMAVNKNYFKTVKKLLRMGADPNFRNHRDETPLHLAALLPRRNLVHLLVKNGGNMRSRNIMQETPFHKACYYLRGPEVILQLLELRADVNAEDTTGCTPLHRLLGGNLLDIDVTQKLVEAFLNHGYNLETKDINGYNVLESSILEDLDLVTLQLLRNGAFLDISCEKSPFLLQCVYQGRHLSRTILKFVALKMSEGVDINMQLLQHLRQSEEVSIYLEACFDEISLLKSRKIHNTTLNYWNLLTKSLKNMAICLNSESVRMDLENFNLRDFPIYGNDLSYKFQKGSKVQSLYCVGIDNLNELTLRRLPDLPIRNILDYLEISDLEILGYFG